MQRIILLIILISLGVYRCSTPIAVEKLEDRATIAFDATKRIDDIEKWTANIEHFKITLQKVLEHPKAMTYDFPLLKEKLRIRTSPDGNLRTFSWRDGTGGTAWSINTFAQFKDGFGKPIAKELTNTSDYKSDVFIREIFEIGDDGNKQYLLSGWGTFGGGQQHLLVRTYEITKNDLVLCDDCFDDKPELWIYAPRSAEDGFGFIYDAENNEIIYNEFKIKEDVGFAFATGEQVFWRYDNHQFYPVGK